MSAPEPSGTQKKQDAKSVGVSSISDDELNRLMHDAMLDQLLDELGAPKEQNGGKLSPFGRLRRIAPDMLADKRRVDFLVEHTHYEFWVHHPDYDAHGGKHFKSEGVVAREVIDSAIKWLSANPEQPRQPKNPEDDLVWY